MTPETIKAEIVAVQNHGMHQRIAYDIGGQIYIGARGAPKTVEGLPADARWESSRFHWDRNFS